MREAGHPIYVGHSMDGVRSQFVRILDVASSQVSNSLLVESTCSEGNKKRKSYDEIKHADGIQTPTILEISLHNVSASYANMLNNYNLLESLRTHVNTSSAI